MSDAILERNMHALRARDADLFALMERTEGDGSYAEVLVSRTGLPVPATKERVAYHSLYDPAKEAVRIIDDVKSPSFCLFAGAGGAYHLREFLSRFPESRCILAEATPGAFRSLIETVDISDLIGNPSVWFLPDCAAPGVAALIARAYLPALHGDFRLVPLRNWQTRFPGKFHVLEEKVAEALDLISRDYSVQAHFGKLWLRNCAVNLAIASRWQGRLPRFGNSREAVIAAAGPSLEGALPALRARQGELVIISTDTAYGTLVDSGIEPDVFVTIDAQPISAAHAMRPMSPDLTVVLDVCGNPDIALRAVESGCNTVFTAGGHPLARFASRYSPLPPLDTSSGTVTLAALGLAHALGIDRARVEGADFAYTGGKPYARGTYLADRFGSASGRLCPGESLYSALMFRTEVSRRESDGTITYGTGTLDRYAAAMASFRAGPVWSDRDFRQFPARAFFLDYSERLSRLAADWESDLQALGTVLPFLAWYRNKARPAGGATVAGGIELAHELIARYTAVS